MAPVTVVVLFLTAPTGAHLVTRSARRMGLPFTEEVSWPGTGGGGAGEDAEDATPGDD